MLTKSICLTHVLRLSLNKRVQLINGVPSLLNVFSILFHYLLIDLNSISFEIRKDIKKTGTGQLLAYYIFGVVLPCF